MKKAIATSLVTATLAFLVFAQMASAQCPTIALSGPSEDVTAGTPLTYTANVSGGDPDLSPTFNWSVSAGAISSGQGTSVIIVDSESLAGQSVTATVELGGLPPACQRTASATASVKTAVAARKSDEYGNIKLPDEKARLDNFALELQMDPTAQAYVIAYGGRKSKPGAAKAALAIVTKHLTKARGIAGDRIVSVDGGYKDEPSRELWIVPAGALPPAPSLTVDPSEITSPKPKAKRAKKSSKKS